jgi:hypothetical protein
LRSEGRRAYVAASLHRGAHGAGVPDDVLGLPLLTFLPIAREIFHGGVAPQRDDVVLGRGRRGRRAGGGWLGPSSTGGWRCSSSWFGALITPLRASRVLWPVPAALFTGAALLIVFSMTASLVQLIVPDHLRGRVVSIYMVAFAAGCPQRPLGGFAAASARRYVLPSTALVALVAL